VKRAGLLGDFDAKIPFEDVPHVLEAGLDPGRVPRLVFRSHRQPQPILIVRIDALHAIDQWQGASAMTFAELLFHLLAEFRPFPDASFRPLAPQPVVEFRSDAVEVAEKHFVAGKMLGLADLNPFPLDPHMLLIAAHQTRRRTPYFEQRLTKAASSL
jgi:hypothetical protein